VTTQDTRLLIATSFDGDWDVYVDDFARTLVLQDWQRFLTSKEVVKALRVQAVFQSSSTKRRADRDN
jgi:hypothetical protein